MTPPLPQEEIERIEANARKAFPITDTSTFSGIMQDAYLAGAIHEAERGREMMVGVLNFAHEMDLELVLRDNGDHQWADFSTNPTTYYVAQQIVDRYISETQKAKT